jgi:hypothetical protein
LFTSCVRSTSCAVSWLVNPVRQLGLVVRKTRGELLAWVRRAKRAAPLLSVGNNPNPRWDDPHAPQHDLTRTAFFQANPGWTKGAVQGVPYAVSLARRYAEQGDHEVSAVAMNAIIAINRAYVEAKGRTFFEHELLLDNPLSADGFINDTLEHLRQNARIGIARGDEQQIEQTLRAMAQLVQEYLKIDYARLRASKTHAHLAAGYLSGEVKRIVPHNMPDVLMEGVRLMGQCADMLLEAEGPKGIITLTQEIGGISCVGVAREDYRPVTSTGVEQLARLSFNFAASALPTSPACCAGNPQQHEANRKAANGATRYGVHEHSQYLSRALLLGHEHARPFSAAFGACQCHRERPCGRYERAAGHRQYRRMGGRDV